MLDRLSWFVTGVVAGGVITIRALRRRPRARDLKSAALLTGADLLDLTARLVQPPRRRDWSPRRGDGRDTAWIVQGGRRA